MLHISKVRSLYSTVFFPFPAPFTKAYSKAAGSVLITFSAHTGSWGFLSSQGILCMLKLQLDQGKEKYGGGAEPTIRELMRVPE